MWTRFILPVRIAIHCFTHLACILGFTNKTLNPEPYTFGIHCFIRQHLMHLQQLVRDAASTPYILSCPTNPILYKQVLCACHF